MGMVRTIQSLRNGRRILYQTQQRLIHHLQIPMNNNNNNNSNQLIDIQTKIFTSRRASTSSSSSSYVLDMRKSAIDSNMLRILRNELDYELQRAHLHEPPAEINGFKVAERPGEQWISLEKQFGDKEEIKLEVTMFDGSVPVPTQDKEIQLHISMIVTIFKKASNQVLEFICSAWPDTVEISNLYVRQRAKIPNKPYTGPNFRELDDELQHSLYEYLEERGIDDSLCISLHNYVHYKVKAEYIRWVKSVKSVMEK